MRLGDTHLTYCTNIHPGESWAEVEANVATYVVDVKRRVSPEAAFGVGLRLSDRAARELAAGRVPAFQALLAKHDLYVFTINGFPHGTFHGAPVKEAVYRPDWLEDERVAYTDLLADLLARLLPDGVAGSISTVPGCFQTRGAAAALPAIASNLERCAAHLAEVERATGKHIALAIEPEPCCVVETIDQAIALFARYLPDRTHLGICLDACHAAVEFEELPGCIERLRAAGVPIAKLQLSAGLALDAADARSRAQLARYVDPVYLHQVVVDGAQRFADLPEALAHASRGEWRVHFHVPIIEAELNGLATTQRFLADLLALQRRDPISTHLEVETYTWDVLPPELRSRPIEDAIASELRWVRERLR
jgi:hypothetical protein